MILKNTYFKIFCSLGFLLLLIMNYKGSNKVVSFGLDKENNNVLQSTTNQQLNSAEVSSVNICYFVIIPYYHKVI